MELLTRTPAVEAMNRIKFVPWEHAMKGVKNYLEKTTGDLNQDIESKKEHAREIIRRIADFTTGMRVGTVITLRQYERYVNMHQELRATMKDIRDATMKISREMQGAVNDSLKLLNKRRPRYLKFLKKEPVPEDEDSPLTIVIGCLFSVIILAILFCLILDYDIYSIGNHVNVLRYTSF